MDSTPPPPGVTETLVAWVIATALPSVAEIAAITRELLA